MIGRVISFLQMGLRDNYLPIEARACDFVESFLEHHLIVVHAGELEEDARCGLCQRETAFDMDIIHTSRQRFDLSSEVTQKISANLSLIFTAFALAHIPYS